MTNKNREEHKRCMKMVKHFIKKILPVKKSDNNGTDYIEEWDSVPNDVKEGHFAVFAGDDGEQVRFIVEIGCLSSLAFMSLLKQAEDEYGFGQKGALVVPCQPQELQKILKESGTAARNIKIIESR